jgi:pyrroloquinoline quinone (PQQ) biosynthesis protein C
MGPVQDLPVSIDSLIEELQSHPVNSNEFFLIFKARQLSPRQLRVFIRQYHYFCFQFVKVLEGLLYHTPIAQVEMRTELAKTLYSELGSGSPEHVHIRQLERFANTIGLRPRDLEDTVPIPEVTMYLETLRRLFLGSTHLTALGAELAVETTAVSEFQYFFPGLQQYGHFNRGDLAFFELHLAEEEVHGQWLINAVRNTAKSDEDMNEVTSGAREAADAWLEFWDGMYRAVFDANPSAIFN